MGCSNRPGFSEDAVPDKETNRDRLRTAGGGVIFPERTSPQRTVRNQVVATSSGYAILAPKGSPMPMDRYRVFGGDLRRRKSEVNGVLTQVVFPMRFHLLSPIPLSIYPNPLENPLEGFQITSDLSFLSAPQALQPVGGLEAGTGDANIINGEYTGRIAILNEFLPYLRFERNPFDFTVAILFDEENQRIFPGYTATINTNLGNITQSVQPVEEDVDSVPPIIVALGGTSVEFLPFGFSFADVPPSPNTTFSFIEITIRGL